MQKTNSMRILENNHVPYKIHEFPDTIRSADEVAVIVGRPAAEVYKTIVLLTPANKMVFAVLPGDSEIDLKKVAAAAGEKTLRMATHKEAEQLTGLKVGGISILALLPRRFPVYFHQDALKLKTFLVSAGKRGLDLELSAEDFARVTNAHITDITMA